LNKNQGECRGFRSWALARTAIFDSARVRDKAQFLTKRLHSHRYAVITDYQVTDYQISDYHVL
jgi:hypothetical protein